MHSLSQISVVRGLHNDVAGCNQNRRGTPAVIERAVAGVTLRSQAAFLSQVCSVLNYTMKIYVEGDRIIRKVLENALHTSSTPLMGGFRDKPVDTGSPGDRARDRERPVPAPNLEAFAQGLRGV